MRKHYSKSEKLEIIKFYEENKIKKTLEKYPIRKQTFYNWYKEFRKNGNVKEPATGKKTKLPKDFLLDNPDFTDWTKEQVIEHFKVREEISKYLASLIKKRNSKH